MDHRSVLIILVTVDADMESVCDLQDVMFNWINVKTLRETPKHSHPRCLPANGEALRFIPRFLVSTVYSLREEKA